MERKDCHTRANAIKVNPVRSYRTPSMTQVTDLQKAEQSGQHTGSTSDGSVWVESIGVALLGCGATTACWCAANVTGLGDAACANVFALDDVVGALDRFECGAVLGDVGGGLEVECAAVVLEGREGDTVGDG